jgi:esterase/lipase superfamily enzyme
MLLALVAGCARAPDLIGIDNPQVPVAALPDLSQHPIFIMSTREASELAGTLFGTDRAPELGLASVNVTVPPTHVSGQLERSKRLPPDPRTDFTVIDPTVYATDAAFIASIDRELARRPRADRDILLFVHGYNNTTSDAVLRLGQFVEDTGFQGVPVLFTWASAASASRYVYDLNSALIARSKIKEMSEILARTRSNSVSVFAHSMGTMLAMEGLVDAQLTGTLGRRNHIDAIMLASPDIDIDLFQTQISILPRDVVERMYLLVSQDDAALRFSRRIAGGVPRVGAADAAYLEQFGVTVIDLSEIEDSSSGSHSKFAGSPEVVRLIGAGLNSHENFSNTESSTFQELLAGVPIRILRN